MVWAIHTQDKSVVSGSCSGTIQLWSNDPAEVQLSSSLSFGRGAHMSPDFAHRETRHDRGPDRTRHCRPRQTERRSELPKVCTWGDFAHDLFGAVVPLPNQLDEAGLDGVDQRSRLPLPKENLAVRQAPILLDRGGVGDPRTQLDDAIGERE
jgi:hypothetical protein